MPDQVDWRTMERDTTAGHAVGRLLRDQREARGLSIADIEKRLRIRRHFVEAIEQGRFDELPGAAYVPAFLRAYSRDIGLDPEKVLTAYNLSGAVPIERPTALPADFPLVEKRAPIGLAVLTVLLVIGAGYGVWHYLPRQQAAVAEKVPPVPDRLLAAPPSTSFSTGTADVRAPLAPATPPASAIATTSAPPPAAAPTSPAPKTSPPLQTAQQPAVTSTQASQPQEVRGASSSALPAGTWPAPRQEPSPPVAPPAVVPVPAAPPPAVMSAPSIGQAQAAQPASVDVVRGTPSAGDAQQATAPPAIANDSSATTTTGAVVVATPSRVDRQVVVGSNSWVELRSPNGDVLAQTYVRAGESYVIPAGIAYRIIQAH